tara:strand:+ start:111 stop:632 length:522 start_codon:yes stop_codon:yes gene_type:complete
MKLNNFKSWLIEKNLNNLDYLKRLSIIDNESLTKRLESETQNNFKVNVISQKTVHKKKIFKKYLQKFSGFNIERKVKLSCNNYSLIYAKSYIPLRYCSGKESFIKILKNKSLGKYLLKSPRFTKEYVRYEIDSQFVHRIIIYKHKLKRIIVNEMFPKDFYLKTISLVKARKKI